MSLIFVVDDDPFLLMETTAILADAGFETLEAPTADAAFAIIQERWQDVAVLVTDVQMSGRMDGLDLAAEVHRCWPNVGVVVVSGVWSVGKGDLPGGARFLPKPFSASTLVGTVRQAASDTRP